MDESEEHQATPAISQAPPPSAPVKVEALPLTFVPPAKAPGTSDELDVVDSETGKPWGLVSREIANHQKVVRGEIWPVTKKAFSEKKN